MLSAQKIIKHQTLVLILTNFKLEFTASTPFNAVLLFAIRWVVIPK